MSVDKCGQYWSDEVGQCLVFDQMEITTLEQTVVVEKEFIQRQLQIKSNISYYIS